MINPKISFKPLSENDLVLLHRWFQVPHVKRWYARNKEYSLQMIKDEYLNRINNNFIPNFIIYSDDKPIGYIQLYHVSYSLPDGVANYQHSLFSEFNLEDIAGIDLFIGDVEYLNKGYASAALKHFIATYVKDKFMLLIADPMKNNEQSIQFFERNNFRRYINVDLSVPYELMVLEIKRSKP